MRRSSSTKTKCIEVMTISMLKCIMYITVCMFICSDNSVTAVKIIMYTYTIFLQSKLYLDVDLECTVPF